MPHFQRLIVWHTVDFEMTGSISMGCHLLALLSQFILSLAMRWWLDLSDSLSQIKTLGANSLPQTRLAHSSQGLHKPLPHSWIMERVACNSSTEVVRCGLDTGQQSCVGLGWIVIAHSAHGKQTNAKTFATVFRPRSFWLKNWTARLNQVTWPC